MHFKVWSGLVGGIKGTLREIFYCNISRIKLKYSISLAYFYSEEILLTKYNLTVKCVLPFVPVDVLGRRHPPPVPPGGPQDPAPHPAPLLRVQGHLGLDHPHPHILHGDHGAVQRRFEEQGTTRYRGKLNNDSRSLIVSELIN